MNAEAPGAPVDSFAGRPSLPRPTESCFLLWKDAAFYSQLLLEYGLTVALATWGGGWVERKTGVPFLAAAMGGLALVLGLWRLVWQLNRKNEQR